MTDLTDPKSEQDILPEIPEGYIRATHFTSEYIAKDLMDGRPFIYRRHRYLYMIVESSFDNEQVQEAIEDGIVRIYFNREQFGPAVVIMDIEMGEFVSRGQKDNPYDTEIPNHNILGYVMRDNPRVLIRNPNYDPKVNI